MDRMRDAMTKTQVERFSDRLGKLGLGNAFAGEIAELKQLEQAAKGAHGGMAGISRELMVMGHETMMGNFSRLGGSAMVLGERINVLHYLLSPLGGAFIATAAGAFVFLHAVYQGVEEMGAFEASLKTTSNSLGMTAGDMRALSDQVSVSGASFTTVRQAMAEVAGTGAFTASQLRLATAAAVAMSEDTGVSTEKAAEQLSRIQGGVMKWVDEYQQAHHAFTAAQIEEIENFVKQGDQASATKTIMDALVGVHAQMAADADANMGTVVRWWHAFKDAVIGAKEAIVNIGTQGSLTQQIAEQTARTNQAQARYNSFKNYDPDAGEAKQSLQDLQDQQQALQKLLTLQKNLSDEQKSHAAGDAKVAVNRYVDSDKYATPARRHSLDLQQEDEDFKRATANLDKSSTDYQAVLKRHYENVQQINEQYDKKSGAGKQQQNVLSGEMASLQGRNQLIEQATKQHLERLKSAYDQGAIDQASYLKQVHDAQTAALDQEIANAQQRATLAQGKRQLSAAQSANTEYQKLLAERKAIDDQYTDALAKAQQGRADALAKFAGGNASTVARQRQSYALEDATRYMSPQQKTDYSAQAQLYESYLQQVQALREKYDFDPKSDKQQEQQELQNLSDTYNQQQQMLQQHIEQETAIRGSFQDQMHGAMVNLAGDGQTTAEATAEAFTKAWEDSTTGLNEFLSEGKGNFDQFVSGVLADMAKIALQFAEMQAMRGLMSAVGMGSGSMGFGGGTSSAAVDGVASSVTTFAATGGHITGPGTGTSDSIPAMLSNGEYVINAAATKKYRGLLDSVNSGNLSHFATGGPVGTVSSPSDSGSGSANPVSVVVNHNGGGGMSDQDAKDLHRMVQSFVDQRMSYQMKRQGGYAYQIRYGQI
jgi:lambda family phage tail tape measure protein